MKYTHEERLEIGRRIYTGEISKYQAAAEYEINYQTARNYMRIYRDTNHLPAKSKTPGHKPETGQTQPVITDPDLEEYESMTKEELIREIVRSKIICCIIKVPKVAEPKWRTLHLQFGECCSGIA